MIVVLLVLVLVLSGCGYPGDTQPPSLHLPTPVIDLSAVEHGSKIIFEFTVPRLTTDGVALKEEPNLVLHVLERTYRVPAAEPHARYEIEAGPFLNQQIRVGLKAENAHGKDAGWSNVIDIAVVQPVPVPAELSPRGTAKGVQLTWRSAARQFAIFRKGPDDRELIRIGAADARVYNDETTEYGKTYQYAVQAFNPPAESDISTPTRPFTPEDKFAPAVPTNLAPVVGPQSVQLLWDRDVEPDLAGYRVYRDGVKIGETAGATSFSDRHIERGKRYRYAVTAYDRLNNESERTEAVEIAIP